MGRPSWLAGSAVGWPWRGARCNFCHVPASQNEEDIILNNLDLPPRAAHDAETLTLIDVVNCRPGLFRADFAAWLRENWPIWKAFEREANAIWRNGRRHYSARTIGEYLRHETALREDGEWKIDNNKVPDMARLYGLMYPERGLFEFRGERKAA